MNSPTARWDDFQSPSSAMQEPGEFPEIRPRQSVLPSVAILAGLAGVAAGLFWLARQLDRASTLEGL